MLLNNFKKIVANAWKIPVYRDFYTKNFSPKTIRSLKDLNNFPIINKEIYYKLTKNQPINFGQNSYVFKTIATISGEEAVFPLSANDCQNYLNFEKRKFELIGVQKNDLCSVIEFSQNHTFFLSQAFLKIGASYIPLDGDENKIFQDIIRYKVTVIFTIPPVVYRLMDYVKERNLKTSLRLIITTGIKIPDVEKLNRETKSILGAELIDTIGATELASFAFSCKKHRNYYHFVDRNQIVEIIDPKTKKQSNAGEIVITPLWKVDFPLIRYGTADFTEIKENLSCNCKLDNKLFINGVEKRLVQSTRIQRYLVDLQDFYYQVRESLLWQNFFDKKLWDFVEKPKLLILIKRIKHTDTVLVFIEKEKFFFTLRKRQAIEDVIFKMTNAETKIIFCQKALLRNVDLNYQDIRDIPKKNLSQSILKLLNLC